MAYETIFVGLLLSVFFIEAFGIYPGGIIVPAYFALYLDEPLRMGVTILAAFMSLLSYRLLSRFLILFGKRRFVTFILLGALFSELWSLLIPHLSSDPLGLRTIGWLIPGLLANNLEKQKMGITLASLFVVASATYFLIRLISWIKPFS